MVWHVSDNYLCRSDVSVPYIPGMCLPGVIQYCGSVERIRFRAERNWRDLAYGIGSGKALSPGPLVRRQGLHGKGVNLALHEVPHGGVDHTMPLDQ